MAVMHPITLSFSDPVRERAFQQATVGRTRFQGRTAILMGMFVYLLGGVLDHWLVGPSLYGEIWTTRLTALCMPTFVLALTFTPWFARLNHLLLAAVGMAAGLGLICMQTFMSVESAAYYYPMMVLATFYTYNFVGTRFVYALVVDLALLTGYNVVFGAVIDYPLHILISHDFFIVSANLIGGSAGYLVERQRRTLFLREQELETERHYHHIRSLHDDLTGLPNRTLLYERLSGIGQAEDRNDDLHAGLFLDLDGFKQINDRLGHKTGDRILHTVAQRLKSVVRRSDTVARIGGDEFFILARDIGSHATACQLADKILATLRQPLEDLPDDLGIETSIGICLFPSGDLSVTDIIHYADQAMYTVKRDGKGDYAVADLTAGTP